ncbi:MAG: hypothetical protein AB7Q00_15675 [Phycisphaerales bacterium]
MTALASDSYLATRSPAELESYGELQADINAGVARPVSEDPVLGPLLAPVLEGLLRHPWCQAIREQPRVYVHSDPAANFVTFGNIIVMPSMTFCGASSASELASLCKGALAHELSHMLCDDSRMMHDNPDMRDSTDMERRADLIAAHLCGDGGASLADFLELGSKSQQMVGADASIETDPRRLRYPEITERIEYLRDWSQQFRHGEKLPAPKFPFETRLRMKESRADDRSGTLQPGA